MAGELTTLGLARGYGIVDTGGGLPPLPAGYSYLTDQKSNNLTTQDGVLLYARTY